MKNLLPCLLALSAACSDAPDVLVSPLTPTSGRWPVQ